MNRLLRNSLIFLLTFVAGFLITNIATSKDPTQTVLPMGPSEPQQHEVPDHNEPYVSPKDNCGEWTYDADDRPIIRKWLNGTKLKRVPYCSKSVIEATGFNPSNVLPTEFDVNDDKLNELALQSFCSATGNCGLSIYERVGNRVRRIFTEDHSVQMFGIQGKKHFGYFDIWTRMHGSWKAGDRVVYRFNGRQYKPIDCSVYEYELNDNGNAASAPTLESVPCSNMLDY